MLRNPVRAKSGLDYDRRRALSSSPGIEKSGFNDPLSSFPQNNLKEKPELRPGGPGLGEVPLAVVPPLVVLPVGEGAASQLAGELVVQEV